MICSYALHVAAAAASTSASLGSSSPSAGFSPCDAASYGSTSMPIWSRAPGQRVQRSDDRGAPSSGLLRNLAQVGAAVTCISARDAGAAGARNPVPQLRRSRQDGDGARPYSAPIDRNQESP
jgi:hypothetical protein